MHDQGVVREQFRTSFVQPVAGAVFADSRNECLGHAFALHAEHVANIDRWQYGVDIGAHLDWPAFEARWKQGWRCNQGDVGAKGSKGCDVAASDSRMTNVADDGDPLTGDFAEPLANCVAIEQRLRGMFVPSVAGVNYRTCRPLCDLPGNARRSVPNHDCVDAHGLDGFDGVTQ